MPDHETYPPFPSSRLPHVGTYRRVLPVSLVRMYENALDWEHLPFVQDLLARCRERWPDYQPKAPDEGGAKVGFV